MVAQNKEVAFIVIAEGLQDLVANNAGVTQAVKIAYLNSKLFNDNLVFRNDRQDLLKKLNNHFQQNWSMSQVKKGDVKLLENLHVNEPQVVETLTSERVEADLRELAKTAVPAASVVETPETDNSVKLSQWTPEQRIKFFTEQIRAQGESQPGTFQVMFTESGQWKVSTDLATYCFTDREGLLVTKVKHKGSDNPLISEMSDYQKELYLKGLLATVGEGDHSFIRFYLDDTTDAWVVETPETDKLHCFSDRGMHVFTREKTQNQNENSNTANEESDMSNAIPENLKTTYESNLKAIANVLGDKTTPEARQAIYQEFLNESETYRGSFAEFQTANPSLGSDELFFMFTAENDEVHSDFMAFLSDRLREKTEPRARFSLVAEGDKGPRGCWIAAGAAVVGGGMEMVGRNGVTVGAAIGTLGAAVGSFFAGEVVDAHIEHRYGRYVTAGLVGMAAGSVGAAVGRNLITGVQLPEFLQGYIGETVVVAEVPAS